MSQEKHFFYFLCVPGLSGSTPRSQKRASSRPDVSEQGVFPRARSGLRLEALGPDVVVWKADLRRLEHGQPGDGGTKTGSENDCAPVLSHCPRRASESMHGWAGVCDVRLPENPIVRRLVVAGEQNLDLSRMLNRTMRHLVRGVGVRQIWVGWICCRPVGVGVLALESGFGIFWTLF